MSAVELNVDQLIDAVDQLTPDELMDFEMRWDFLRLRQTASVDDEAAAIVARHRLSPKQHIRVKELLQKNNDGHLTSLEEDLDRWLAEIDRRTLLIAKDIQQLAKQRQQDSEGDTSRG